MPGYLEGYGAGDEKREKKVRWALISLIGLGLLSGVLYASFRNYKEERRVHEFLQALQHKDYKAAYTYWGCTADAPCSAYTYATFLEDWGEKGANAKFGAGELSDSERCGSGFIAAISSGREEVALWVERSSGVLGYAPWRECPEKRLRIRKWLRMKFGKG